MGFALGVIRMSRDDFCRCTVEDFEAVCRAYNAQREFDYKDDWERMRMLASIVIQPHVRGKISAKNLLHFAWEKQPSRELEKLSYEERMQRAEAAKKKFGIG